MGSFYTNITLNGPDQKEVAEFLSQIKRNAYVSETKNKITVVYDEECDDQDTEVLENLTQQLSKQFNCYALGVLNHDDDLFLYFLANSGETVDSYNSCPGYFEGTGDEEPEGGDAEKLCEAFDKKDLRDRLEAPLRQKGYTFAQEIHEQLADALGIDFKKVNQGYYYLQNAPSSGKEGLVLVQAADPNSRARRSRPRTKEQIEVESFQEIRKRNYEPFKKIIEDLIAIKIPNNPIGSYGMPLHNAIYWGYNDLVDKLFAQGADITLKDSHDNTILHLAAAGGQIDYVKWSYEKGIPVNSQNNDGFTPIFYAVRHSRYEPEPSLKICEFLIEKGSDLKHRDINGDTVLHIWAKYSGETLLLLQLLIHGADINARNRDGKTPQECAFSPVISDFLKNIASARR